MATPLITRSEAKAQGLKRYFTGVPCARGHAAERWVSNMNCVECGREKSKLDARKRDPVTERKRLRDWEARNRAKVNLRHRERNRTPAQKAYSASWYQANKERIRAARRARYEAQRSERIAYTKAWVQAHPEEAAEHNRIGARVRRGRKHDAGGTHTAVDLKEILEAQGHRCAYCRADLIKTAKHVDHIIPLARGGSNGRANLQYLCAPCNQAKNAKDPADFARSIGLLV